MTEIKSKIDTDINSNCFTRVREITEDVGYQRGRVLGSGSRIESNGRNNIGNITPYETHNRLVYTEASSMCLDAVITIS